ncbi:uncharacterized protein I206_100485 [Kwoniella pini CBS 10737]|uniref:Phosphatidylinositol-specific phospholipase C X domain-containing protein n=1 Tax=Kwoniella pini CBS 10737 TaxID=1296096 RepID=A0A1B9IDI0_9TREE|nr:uncharacterized protein I206_00842 [Kwoniella pini CBS 10737]OCF53537.1 hypothetical protein I206_00842 [Kwoniella pini CBS 10737]
MEIYAPGIVLISASTGSSQSKGNAWESSRLHRKGKGRYLFQTAPTETKESINLHFHSRYNEKQSYRILLPVLASRSSRQRGWKQLHIEGSGGYSAYRLYTTQSDGSNRDSIIILERPDTANFLSRIPDVTPLGEITLPGTHESCAMYGYPISQCQQPATPIEQQLLDGIRFLDVRLRVVGEELLMYHGPRPQRSTLSILLQVLHNFLETHPTETLILSIKQETPPWHPDFSTILYKAFQPFLDKWFLEERIPTLGEVRGKGLLLTRFDKDKDGDESWQKGMGIHPYTWPDSRKEGFEWNCEGTAFRIQDWYRVHTFLEIPEKFDAITTHLIPTLEILPRQRTFTLSYLSASYFPLSLPTIIAKGFGWPSWGLGVEGINSRMFGWLLERLLKGEKVRACFAIDFYGQCAGNAGLAELLVQMNFNEEGS